MKIKLAILEKDLSYLNRIVNAFNTKYADKLEIYSFTSMEVALQSIESSKIDVLLANECFDIDVSKLPKRCAFAYLVEMMEIDEIKEQRAIGKFQKADLIYKQILSIYSEKTDNISMMRGNDENGKLIVFASPSRGTGSSTMAASFSIFAAQEGKKVLYLNLESFGDSDLFFSGEGQFGISDVIYALKSKKANISLKLESCVKQDFRGVYFFSQPKTALDIMELGSEDTIRLINEIQLSGKYDYIVIDTEFELNKLKLKIFDMASNVVMTGDGTEISNKKIMSAYNAALIIQDSEEINLVDKWRIIYNKFSNKSGQILDGVDLRNIGGTPRYDHADTQQILTQISTMIFFSELI